MIGIICIDCDDILVPLNTRKLQPGIAKKNNVILTEAVEISEANVVVTKENGIVNEAKALA